MSDDPREALARHLGIAAEYHDLTGERRPTAPETRDALLAAMGAPTDPDAARDRLAALRDAEAARPIPLCSVITADAPAHLAGLQGHDWTLTLEDGQTRMGQGPDLDALPLGIHAIDADGRRAWLLSAPDRLPEPPRGWGVTLPLYGLAPDGRIGHFGHLAQAVEGLGRAGAGFAGVNPIHAGFPTAPDAISPYAPSHRGRLSPMHVAPAAEDPIPAAELLDYREALPARMAALRAEFAGGPADGFDDWLAAQDDDLHRFALHQALADHFGPYWPDWPQECRRPDSDAVRAFADGAADAIRFHAWLQWRAETQLAEVQAAADRTGMAHGLYLDLAVGTHPAGAETWGASDLFALGVSLGAPPDAFSAEGQSWGLAPLRPDTLADRGFRPLAAILRRQLAHARLLRIDHILGFERAFWVPQGPQTGTPGGYVQMPRDALLAVARIEAARVGAAIIGEDLGNIPGGLRGALDGSGILGCRVTQFEQDWEADTPTFLPADGYARSALTSFTTHDLPTWEGWLAGRDIVWRHALGALSDAARDEALAHRKAEAGALTDRIGGRHMDDIHRFLAATPSRVVAVQIEDLLGRTEQPNLPGTVHDHPNWRRRLGPPPETLGQLDAVARTTTLMRDADR